ncbi:Mu-like prophage I protein [Serratia ficaria]|uniref:phage protease n=1 Tax=Serratia ficaria TaxID=61651 RepID=UPI002183CDB3|nr:phage protease [Serratia ficaria]CAI2519925.1 Mu-like prophage I protein [Serratia ficaria]CAI2538599.1 Mu-like prophage I protein [Serratia ficaria]
MKRNVAVASLAFALNQSGNTIQLFPAGEFRANDGRPAECANWVLNESLARQVIAHLSSRQNKIVIDYEHQTLRTESNGQPAPAAGWWKGSDTVWTDAGMFAQNIEWTAAARKMIADGEYRYISPVFAYDKKTGAVLQVLNAALTNNPALDGMNQVVLAAASRLIVQASTQNSPEKTMNEELLKLLRKLLGLADDASEADVLAALQQAAGAMPKENDGDTAAASLNKLLEMFTALTAKSKEKDDKIAALTVSVTAASKDKGVDPTKYVPIAVVTDLTTQLAALTARVDGGDLDGLITAALSSGKLLPTMETWARDMGKKDIAALRGYLDAAAPIAALTTLQNGGKPPTGDTHGLTAVELEVAALTGFTPAEFAAAKKEVQ